jgi:hypothetical protein
MLRSIAIIHLFLVIHSQMARLSNRRRRQPKNPPDSSRPLDCSSYILPVQNRKRERMKIHPRRSQRSSRKSWPLQLGAASQIPLRLTHRRYQQCQSRGHAGRDSSAPSSDTDPSGGVGQEDGILSKGKDRKYWLRHLRPRSSRGLDPAGAKNC